MSQYLTFDNFLALAAISGWLFAALIVALRWIAPRTETKVDDALLGKLEWLQSVAPGVFLKVKFLHESKQLPAGVDRYAEYLIRLGEAFSKTFGGSLVLPTNLEPTAKLLADGLHAEVKLNNPSQPPAKP